MNSLLYLLAQETVDVATAPSWAVIVIAILVAVIQIALFVYVMIDVAKSDRSGGYKLLWIAIVFFFPCIGAIAYLALRGRM
ncbi:MAG: PLD nuclease N-terminal domain-containing protein [Sumerlaeia bacterium]